MMSYDNITLVSRKISKTIHRNGDTRATLVPGHLILDIPMIASPMPDVCNGRMARTLAEKGVLGIIHRFQSIDSQVDEFILGSTGKFNKIRVGCAIGVTGDYLERFNALYKEGCRVFCLDTANGANIQVGDAILKIRGAITPIPPIREIYKYSANLISKEYQDLSAAAIILIAGNVMSAEGYEYLQDKVEAVRVSIAGGSVCETRTETGIHMPTLESVCECIDVREAILTHNSKATPAAIIADGGIRTPADMCKALAVGADAVMCGSIFAGTSEAPGDVLMMEDRQKKKLYRGAASFSVQRDSNPDREIMYNEGRESFVDYKGSVEKILKRYQAGLQSSMSYADATNLREYRDNIEVLTL